MKNIENEIAALTGELRAWAMKRLNNAADADDVAQDAILIALKAKDRVESNLRGFVFRIATRVISDRFEARKRLPVPLTTEPVARDASEAPNREALDRAIRRAARGTYRPERLVRWARMAWFDHMTYREVAALSRVEISTVKNALARLAKRIRAMSPKRKGGRE